MQLPCPHRPRSRGRSGFSLLEVAVAACVLAIALSGLIGALVTTAKLHRVSAETALAHRAAVEALEDLQGVPFDELFRIYNASTDDDAGLSVAARGADFDVPGLDAALGDADGLCGEIEFPALANGTAAELREDFADARLGMPRDLDRDGAIDGADHAGDYELLPVRVRVRWRGVSGAREVVMETVLCER